jgi:hypothetical protein
MASVAGRVMNGDIVLGSQGGWFLMAGGGGAVCLACCTAHLSALPDVAMYRVHAGKGSQQLNRLVLALKC